MSKSTYYRDDHGIEAFGKRLRLLRKRHGYSQERLANECDLPLSQISRIETGKVNTSLSHICLLARTLDVRLAELMDFKLD